jgi:hypothetical protein
MGRGDSCRACSAVPADRIQHGAHALLEPALLATPGERDAVVEDARSGGTQRLAG